MTITREINGTLHTIELTEREIYAAHLEEQKSCDRADIDYYADIAEEENEDMPHYSDAVRARAAAIFRDRLDWCDAIAEIREELIGYALHEAMKKEED